jgi:hypothetical protein
MFSLPDRGVERSIRVHNSSVQVLADWCEASALYFEVDVSYANALDVLREADVYADDDFAWDFLSLVAAEHKRRVRALGVGYPFDVTDDGLSPRFSINERAEYGFCLTASLCPNFSAYRKLFANSSAVSIQGELFEQITLSSMARMFPIWTAERLGWSSGTARKFPASARHVGEVLGLSVKEDGIQIHSSRNDAGADVICYRKFRDALPDYQVMFISCATGYGDWKKKRAAEPAMGAWTASIEFYTRPTRGFAVPFVLSPKKLRETATLNKGLVMDRLRVLEPAAGGVGWIPSDLDQALALWNHQRFGLLPVAA